MLLVKQDIMKKITDPYTNELKKSIEGILFLLRQLELEQHTEKRRRYLPEYMAVFGHYDLKFGITA